ncbi:translation initiation factor [Pseudidiomarina taiwanensis]|uniref:Stress response translation initiation inhibitor YciH n=1 Tax=Pseudidiomarina taiwanensis TaxID=337250 RepID=A0A432ZMF5_9GAMM|nr:stress response translation initiation inhibitor YciH [Pseudidiomarina taiwanensis]RUO79054.1 stress response translation initiation inhibitor YciH [Pseudidiomarina taiwanensis]
MSSLADQLKNLGFKETESDTSEQSIEPSVTPKQDTAVTIQRQTKGRKGKGVTVIDNLQVTAATRAQIASTLRKSCGVGGSVKAETIELQGDQRQTVKAWFEQQGYKVKFTGG